MTDRPKTLQRFFDDYIYGSEENRQITDNILHVLLTSNFVFPAVESIERPASSNALHDVSHAANDSADLSAQFFIPLSKILDKTPRPPLKQILEEMDKTIVSVKKHADVGKTSVIQLKPLDILPYWAAVTLTAMEGRSEELPDEIKTLNTKIITRTKAALSATDLTVDDIRKIGEPLAELNDEIVNFGSIDKPVRAVSELMTKFSKEIQAVRSTGGPGTGWTDRRSPQDRDRGQAL